MGAIGMVSARLDDVANFIPARLSWLLISLAALLCGEAGGRALRIGWRDRYNHSSPNCGWSEAAVAGALELRVLDLTVGAVRRLAAGRLRSGEPVALAA